MSKGGGGNAHDRALFKNSIEQQRYGLPLANLPTEDQGQPKVQAQNPSFWERLLRFLEHGATLTVFGIGGSLMVAVSNWLLAIPALCLALALQRSGAVKGKQINVQVFFYLLVLTIGGLAGYGVSNAMRKSDAHLVTLIKETGSVSGHSNAQIKDSALALARRIRELQHEEDTQQSAAFFSFVQAERDASKASPKAEVLRKQEEAEALLQKRETDIGISADTRFGPLRAESRNLIIHLENRVPAPQPLPSELVEICLSSGPCAGPSPYEAVADYIEQLADLVPVNR